MDKIQFAPSRAWSWIAPFREGFCRHFLFVGASAMGLVPWVYVPMRGQASHIVIVCSTFDNSLVFENTRLLVRKPDRRYGCIRSLLADEDINHPVSDNDFGKVRDTIELYPSIVMKGLKQVSGLSDNIPRDLRLCLTIPVSIPAGSIRKPDEVCRDIPEYFLSRQIIDPSKDSPVFMSENVIVGGNLAVGY
jgi:hypothetical protein